MASDLESLIPSGRVFQHLGVAVAKLLSPNMSLRVLAQQVQWRCSASLLMV